MLKKGVSVPTIVNWFEREAWLGTMSPSTFTQYLYKFKTECADIIKGSVQPNESYDHYVGTNIPSVNAETELDKLIMIQKRRLSVDIATEIGIGKLLDNTHKEIVALGELLKLKGLKTADADTATDSMALRTMRVNEGEQDRMQELTTDLFKAIKDASKTGNSSKSKQKQRA